MMPVDIDEQERSLAEKNAEQLSELLGRFMDSYTRKSIDFSDEEWLKAELIRELPELPQQKIEEMTCEIFQSIHRSESLQQEMASYVGSGGRKEAWFAKKMQDAAVGMEVQRYGDFLSSIQQNWNTASDDMLMAITKQNGGVNRNPNLDGFIAEQFHVNTFNADALLKGRTIHAEVRTPGSGEVFARNSVDIRVTDTGTGKYYNYQVKYGKTAKETINLINNGDYRNQRLIVPEEQLAEVKQAFPNKSISARIELEGVSGKGLSKEGAKELQYQVQEKGQAPHWNYYKTQDLAAQIAKTAGQTAVLSAGIGAGFEIAAKAIQGKNIEANEVIEIALRTGSDAGIKAAAAGALTVGVQRGFIPMIARSTPAGVIANIAYVGVENVKVLVRVAKGDLTITQGMSEMQKTTISAVAGLYTMTQGAALGALALSWIPVVGPVVGGFVGGTIGYLAGSTTASYIFNGIQKVNDYVKDTVKKAWNSVKSGAGKMLRSIFN